MLYHNLGGLKFEDVTRKAGLTHTGWGQGVCAGDIDNDGNVDVFITQWGQNVLYRNQGNGTFRDETEARGLAEPKTRWSTGCAFVDFNRDGALDLVVVHYIEFDPAKTPHPGEKSQCEWKEMPVICGPRGLPRVDGYALSERWAWALHRCFGSDAYHYAEELLLLLALGGGLRQ